MESIICFHYAEARRFYRSMKRFFSSFSDLRRATATHNSPQAAPNERPLFPWLRSILEELQSGGFHNPNVGQESKPRRDDRCNSFPVKNQPLALSCLLHNTIISHLDGSIQDRTWVTMFDSCKFFREEAMMTIGGLISGSPIFLHNRGVIILDFNPMIGAVDPAAHIDVDLYSSLFAVYNSSRQLLHPILDRCLRYLSGRFIHQNLILVSEKLIVSAIAQKPFHRLI